MITNAGSSMLENPIYITRCLSASTSIASFHASFHGHVTLLSIHAQTVTKDNTLHDVSGKRLPKSCSFYSAI